MASSMPTPSSLASSSMSRRNYGVFLSFRGPDCRNTIVSHLYHALCQKGVYVFKDNEELEAGHRRSELFEAIEGSRIAVVMFSQNYARSRWCLDELKKIIDCKDQGKLTVLPIFYWVRPREVRLHEKENGEKGCYQAAMEEMEAEYGKDSKMVKGWKHALWQGGDMIGFQLSQGQDEGTVVLEVVEKVLKILDRIPLEVAKHPVGIDRKLEAIMPLLRINPHENNVYMIGIVGEGGMGKTTISKAICNNIVNRFDDWCFLPNVRETSRVVNGLALLQRTLLRQLLSSKDLIVWSVDGGKELIKERLRNKRVLVILDDVDELAQFDALAGNLDWFGKGSRIIITTRNSHLLHPDRVQHVYKLSLLEKAEADSLFRLHAFGERQENIDIGRDLIERFVGYASQLPLALVVLGAFLRSRSTSEWEGKLNELKDRPDRTINSVLRISFEGLEDDHKEIFLDVACFFKGWDRDKVEKILDSCGFATSLGIAILIERCLVTVDGGTIQMHDLLGVMGQNVVRDDYLKGLPSRIWLYKDFLEVLSKNMAQEKHSVKGIVLNLAEKKDGLVKPNALMGFRNLRIFIARNGDGPQKPLRLPGELRYLEWQGYSASSIEFDQSSNKIVGLDLEKSRITKIEGKGFKELKYVNLSNCFRLAALPDVSNSLKLEFLFLMGCKRLTTLDEAVGSLENLVYLNAEDCDSLAKVPSLLRSKRLKTLAFTGCRKLNRLPAFNEEFKFLQVLKLTKTSLKELPESIGNLIALKILDISDCKNFSIIPHSIYKLRALKELCFQYCPKLKRLPRSLVGSAADVFGLPNLEVLSLQHCRLKDLEFLEDLTCFQTLKKLHLSGNEFARVPWCLRKFKNLQILQLRDCRSLIEVPEIPSDSICYVNATRCFNLRTFPSLHTLICRSPSSYEVDLCKCGLRGLGRNFMVNVDLSRCGLGRNFMVESLPLEKVRRFTGAASVICTANELPRWVNFQTMECGSPYQVSLPGSMSEDHILGLTFFITVEHQGRSLYNGWRFDYMSYEHPAGVMVGGNPIYMPSDKEEAVYTWFVYIPRQSIGGCNSCKELNWRSITFGFLPKHKFEYRRLGLRMLCKREEHDERISVRKIESNERVSSGPEYESGNKCLSCLEFLMCCCLDFIIRIMS